MKWGKLVHVEYNEYEMVTIILVRVRPIPLLRSCPKVFGVNTVKNIL